MKVLLWVQDSELQLRISGLLSAIGSLLFCETKLGNIAAAAKRDQPLLIVLAPNSDATDLQSTIKELATHPDTRWVPIALLSTPASSTEACISALNSGASYHMGSGSSDRLLTAQFEALKRSALRLAALHSIRITDEKTGFYHQSFLVDQLNVLCRKKRRDGIPFCLLFLELRGEEDSVGKAASSLSNTVRGADLFGRWEQELFCVLLPSSQVTQALLLAERFRAILAEFDILSRAAIVASDSGAVETEAFIEAAHNTLDEAWSRDHFLWTWDGIENRGKPHKLDV